MNETERAAKMPVPHFGNVHDQIGVEKLMDQAKKWRSRYLTENYPHLRPAIGWATAVLGLVFIVMFAPRSPQQRALEATAFMERFAAMLADAKTIRPEAARDISRLLRAQEFSCIDLACDAALERRNRNVRMKLSAILARAAHSSNAVTSGQNAPTVAEARREKSN